MRVLQINSVCETGSTGKIVVQISDRLDQMGIENYIAYGLGDSKRPNTYKIGVMLDAHLHSFISRRFCMQGYGSYFTTLRLLRYIERIHPTIIHLHNIHGHYLNFPLLFKYLNKRCIQVVWTFHDCWPFTGKCAHYLSAGCDKWKVQCKNCPQLATYPDSIADRSEKNFRDKKTLFMGNKKLHIVTVSKWLQCQVEQSFLGQKPIHTIYNGINTSVFYDKSQIWKKTVGLENKFLILGVSSVWNEKKGLHDFLELAKKIDQDTAIVLVGLTEEQKKQMPNNIFGISVTRDQNELAFIYSACDVFVHLSQEETFGLVIAEAMACGTPAIVYNASACPEVIGTDCGYIVPAGDIKDVHEKILTIKEKGKNYYSNSARQRVKEKFSQKVMVDSYLQLYRNVIAAEEDHV